MTTDTIKEITEASVLHTYNRFPIVLERGEGVHLWDTDGKEYLDFAAGIAVFALGYHYPGYDEAVKAQIDRIVHTSNLFYNVPLASAAARLIKASGMARAFFTNSGAEAIEGAVKAARKYAYTRDGVSGHEIVAMNHSFHGRTVGALSVTGNAHYQDPFKPLMGGVKFAEFNNFDSVLEAVTDRTCAIILETVQGEGGIFPADPDFLKNVRKLCDERDILLILDEIQCGMGRTGEMWAFQHYGVKPDIMTTAKALGCGIPVGAFLLNEKTAASSLMPGDHGTTYGGNPLAMAAVDIVLSLFESEKIVDHVKEITPVLASGLDEIASRYSCIREHRGLGLMRGLEFDETVKVSDVVAACHKKGLIVISAGSNVLRLVPPLVIGGKDVEKAVEAIDEAVRGCL